MTRLELACAARDVLNERCLVRVGTHEVHVVDSDGYTAIVCGSEGLWDTEDCKPTCDVCDRESYEEHVCPGDTVAGVVDHCASGLRDYIARLAAMLEPLPPEAP